MTVKFSGEKVMKDIQIKPEAIDPDDPDMLQDLIIEAVNQAMADIDKQTQDKLGRVYTRTSDVTHHQADSVSETPRLIAVSRIM